MASSEGLTRADRNGTTVLGLRMPSTVDLFGKYESAPEGARPSWVYRFISGYSHGQQWAMMLNAQTVQPIDERRVLRLVTANDGTTIDITARAVQSTTRAVDAYVAYRNATA